MNNAKNDKAFLQVFLVRGTKNELNASNWNALNLLITELKKPSSLKEKNRVFENISSISFRDVHKFIQNLWIEFQNIVMINIQLNQESFPKVLCVFAT